MEKDKKGKRKLPISFFGKKGSFRFLFFKKGNEKRKKGCFRFPFFSKKEMKKDKKEKRLEKGPKEGLSPSKTD